MMSRYRVAICASQGGRKYQEDTAAVWPGSTDLFQAAELPAPEAGHVLAVLADGMGGHAGGATASRLAVDTFVAGFARGSGGVTDRLQASLDSANAAIADKIVARPMFAGMGTTLIGAHFGPEGLEWVSVGDSPLFLWRAGGIEVLNEDHSMAPEIDRLAEAGKISWNMARADPRRHYLRSAVTGGEMELIDCSSGPRALLTGDIVILASDGIHTLAAERIASEVRAMLDRADPALHPVAPDAIAKRLLDTVLEAGVHYQDNATLVVVAVGEE